MSRFRMTKMPPDQSTVEHLIGEMERFNLEPDYQRQSGIWSIEKRQLFVDSLINGYDVPKLYFHLLSRRGGSSARYAIVDGKQRLETIRGFRDGDFDLSLDFLDAAAIKNEDAAAGMGYRQLSKEQPALAARFSKASLDVVVIETDAEEVIEELFSRLNEAVPLNAPEKRNAIGGAIPPIIRSLVKRHRFFRRHLPIENSRYRQYDLAAKFLYLAHAGQFVATKRRDLDDFVRQYRDTKGRPIRLAEARRLSRRVSDTLDRMAAVFEEQDELLSSVGLVTVYFMAFLLEEKRATGLRLMTRSRLVEFDALRRHNRSVLRAQQAAIARGETAGGERTVRQDLAIFDRLMQSPNDGQALEYRYKILQAFLRDSQFRERLPKELERKVTV